MDNAGLVVFHRPYPRFDDHYRTQAELFFKYAEKWLPLLKTLYVVDGGWGLKKLPKNVRQIFADGKLHWEHFHLAIPKINEENVMLIDPDMLVYDPAIVKEGFEKLNDFDCSAILDNSGQVPLEERFSQLAPTKERGVRRRITPYLCFIKTKHIKQRDFTPVPNKFDSMGLVTEQLLSENIKLHEMADDRTTLRLREDGSMEKDSWLDGPGFSWSEPLEAPQQRGYYHVRNSTLGLSLLTEWAHDKKAYENRKAITPFAEAMRLLAWQWVYDDASSEGNKWENSYTEVLADWGVSIGTWSRYIRHFYTYHAWLNS